MDEYQARETSPLLLPNRSEALYNAIVEHDSENQVEGVKVPDVKFKSYWSYVIPMTVGILLSALDGTIIISSYASIGSDLNQLQNTSWIATAYFLALTSFQPLLGRLSDIFGRKTCLLTCYVIFGLGCLFCGIATTMNQLIAARALAGVGGGGMTSLVTIIMSDIVPLRMRGTWQGILTLVYTVGSTAGAPLGGFIVDNISWRWTFLLQVPVCFAAFASVSLTLHLPSGGNSSFSNGLKRIDFGGAATVVLSVFFLLFGLDRGGNVSWSDRWTLASFVAFILFSTLFVYIETFVASEPFVPPRIAANYSLLVCYITNFFGMVSVLAQIFYVSLFFQVVQGMSASEGSLWLLPCMAGNLIGAMGGGLVIQYTGKSYAITVTSYLLLLTGTIVLYLSSGVVITSTIGVGVGLALTSVGNASGITTTLVSIIANAGKEDQALATAASYLFRSLGAVVGVSVGSSLIQDTLRYWLNRRLSGHDIEEIIRRVRESLDYIYRLDPATRAVVVRSYEDAIQVTFVFTVIMGAFAAVFSLFVKEMELGHQSIPSDR